MRESREEEYIRRMRERGYTPTLAGMDDEDIEWELNKMDGMDPFGGTRPVEQALNPERQGVDRDFAERIFRMFARPFDPQWKMPDTSGPEYVQMKEPKGYGGNKEKIDWASKIIGNVYGPNKDGEPQNNGYMSEEEWEKWKEINKRMEGIRFRPPNQPPFKIIVGGKELEIDENGKPVFRF